MGNGLGRGQYPNINMEGGSKVIPVTGRGGLQGCEMLRISHILDNRIKNGGEIVSLMRRPRFYRQEYSWNFC
jgi:hypothetical protein